LVKQYGRYSRESRRLPGSGGFALLLGHMVTVVPEGVSFSHKIIS
jgi:hypothetical protein